MSNVTPIQPTQHENREKETLRAEIEDLTPEETRAALADVRRIKSRRRKAGAPPANLRKDLDEVRDTLHQGRAALGVAVRSLNAKDDDGSNVAEEIQALQLAYTTISNAEALLDDLADANAV